VDHSYTGSPAFNPRIFKVAIKGATSFPKKEKAQGSHFEEVLWLVSIGTLTIPNLCTYPSLMGFFK